MEICTCIYGVSTVMAATQVAMHIFNNMMATDAFHIQLAAGLPLGDYVRNARNEVARCTSILHRRRSRSLDELQKWHARLYNAVGYHSSWWFKILDKYQVPTVASNSDTEEEDGEVTPEMRHKVEEAAQYLKTRTAAKHKSLMCAI